MIVFLDFEASSLTKHSYPIEVAWVFEDDRSQSLLIKPNLDWTDWSDQAALIHGITRDELENEGFDVNDVVAVMMEALPGNELHASSPSWDGKWLSVLLRGAGLPRHALRLRKSDDLRRSGSGHFERSEHRYRYPGNGCRRCLKDGANRSAASRSTRCKA